MQTFSFVKVPAKFNKLVAIFAVSLFFILLTLVYNNAQAGHAIPIAFDNSSGFFGGGGLRMKQSGSAASVAQIQFGTDSNTKKLTSVTITFAGTAGTPTWTSGQIISSELADLATTDGGIQLWKDAGTPGFQGQGIDTQITLANSPTYATGTSFVITPVTNSVTLATDETYFVVLKPDIAGVTNNNAFTVGIATTGIVTSVSSPTLAGALTTQAITMDTVAPTLDTTAFTGSAPANNATNVSISTFMNMIFSEQMDFSTMNPANITFTQAGAPVGAAIRTMPNGFNLIVSNAPTYTASSIWSKVSGVVFGFFNIPPSGPFFPQGGTYVSPTAGDIVYFQSSTFPAALGVITNATTTAGTFAVNNFLLFGGQSISKFATATATGAVSAATALSLGDLVVANTTANPTTDRYAWHLVTAAGAANGTTNTTLRLDGASAVPTYVASSNWSKLSPTDTSAVNGASAVVGSVNGGINFMAGELVFAKITAGGDNLGVYAWHIVTTAQNVTTDIAPADLRLDGAAAAPTFAVSTQVSKLTPGATGEVTESVTAFSTGDLVFAKATANAGSLGSYGFHFVSNGATGANNVALRYDNVTASLLPSLSYVINMGVGLKDKAGNAFAGSMVTFTTGSNSGTNTTPPFVQSSQPVSGAQTHPINAPIKLVFSVDMASSGGGSVLTSGNIGLFADNFGVPGTAITATNTYDSATRTVTITPSTNLTASTGYLVKVATTTQSSTSAPLPQPYFLFFKTASGVADATAPTVLGVNPATGSTGVSLSTVLNVGFSEDMDPATIISGRVKLALTSDPAATVAGTVTYNPQGRSASFSPSTALTASTSYTATIVAGGSGVKDLSGNMLASDSTSTFTTTATADTTGPSVSFSGADNFGVAVTFNEQVKTGGGPNAGDNVANYTLESPIGSSISLAGKTVTYDGASKTAKISGLSLQNGNTYKITVGNFVQDLSNNIIVLAGTPPGNVSFGTVANSTITGGNLGPGMGTIDPSMQGMNPTRVTPMSRAAGATSNYKVEFLAATSIPTGGTIVLTFPSGFTVTSANKATAGTASFCNSDINGPASGTITIASVTNDNSAVTVTLATAGGATGANAFICMDLTGIVNSTVPNSSGYTVDIKTKSDSAGNFAILETKTTGPFFLGAVGARTLTVNVFKDAGVSPNGTNDAAEGINGVTVYLFSPATGGQEATTATVTIAGVASFTGLADGDYMVGIKPNVAIDVAFNSAPQPIRISANTVKNFALSNAAALTIAGTITGTNGTKVDIFASSNNGFTKKTVTLTGGADAYFLPVSANSTYNVGVGPAMPESFFTPGAPPPPMPDFTFMPPPNLQVVVVSANVTGKNFILSTASKTITGTVVDSGGVGVSTAGIFCRPVATSTAGGASGFGTGAQTSTTGAFTVKVTEGVYTCGVFKPGMPSVSDKQITVGASANTPTTLAFVLDASSTSLTITGTVKDDSGNAIPYAGISGRKVTSTSDTTALGGDSSNFVGGPTDSNGAYTLYVSAGTWVVEAFAPGFGKLGTKTITISTSSSSGQDFSAENTTFRTITGTATSGGVAAQGVMVRAETSNGSNGNMTASAADGTYTIKVPDGTYNVSCFFPGVGDSAAVGGAITLSSGTATAVRNCTAGTLVTVTVQITDGSAGITGAGVDVRDSNGRGNFTNVSTISGIYAVYTVKVPPGTYTVRAGHPTYGKLGETASVSADGTITYTTAGGIGAAFAVTGTVTGDGTALSGAWVSLIGTPTGSTNKVFTGGQTASNGTFSVSVPAGSYRLRVDKPGYKSPAESTATVTAATAVGTIALTTAGRTITGSVTLSGSGISNAFVDANDGAGGYAVSQTDASGAYSLAVDNGTWTLRAHAPGYTGGPTPVTVLNNSPSSQTITLTAISGFTVKPEKPETVTPTSGGFLTNTDIGSNFKLNIPANALGTGSNAATVTTKQNTAMPNPSSGSILSKNAVTISAVGSDGSKISSLSDSVTITLPYDEANLPSGASEANLVIGTWNDATQTYDTLPTTVDTVNNTLTAMVSHFSDFAPIVPSDASAPATPSGLALTNPNNGSQLSISWTTVAAASTYNIYRSTDNSSFPLLTSTASTSHTSSGLTSGTTYYFKVSSVASSGSESAASSVVSGVPLFISSGSGGGYVAPAVAVAVVAATPATPATPAITITTMDPGCSGSNKYNTSTGAICVNNAVTLSSPASSVSTASSTGTSTYALGTVTLKNGSRGEPVKELQRLLNKVLNLGLKVDGKLGPKTIAVIKKWQKDNGLKADGLIGPKTKAKMNASVQ